MASLFLTVIGIASLRVRQASDHPSVCYESSARQTARQSAADLRQAVAGGGAKDGTAAGARISGSADLLLAWRAASPLDDTPCLGFTHLYGVRLQVNPFPPLHPSPTSRCNYYWCALHKNPCAEVFSICVSAQINDLQFEEEHCHCREYLVLFSTSV